MSYRLGFQAFVKRFEKRFPEPEYRYVVSIQETPKTAPRLFTGGNENGSIFLHVAESGGNIHCVSIYHGKTDELICKINANLTFGIRLDVDSKYLKRGHLHLHRRPKNLIFQNQHGMRFWLQNKPKFAKLGASLASQIHFAYAEACHTCKKNKHKYDDKMCEECHQIALDTNAMISEGNPHHEIIYSI